MISRGSPCGSCAAGVVSHVAAHRSLIPPHAVFRLLGGNCRDVAALGMAAGLPAILGNVAELVAVVALDGGIGLVVGLMVVVAWMAGVVAAGWTSRANETVRQTRGFGEGFLDRCHVGGIEVGAGGVVGDSFDESSNDPGLHRSRLRIWHAGIGQTSGERLDVLAHGCMVLVVTDEVLNSLLLSGPVPKMVCQGLEQVVFVVETPEGVQQLGTRVSAKCRNEGAYNLIVGVVPVLIQEQFYHLHVVLKILLGCAAECANCGNKIGVSGLRRISVSFGVGHGGRCCGTRLECCLSAR